MSNPNKSDIQKAVNACRNPEAIIPSAFSNKLAQAKKVQDALNKGETIIILKGK